MQLCTRTLLTGAVKMVESSLPGGAALVVLQGWVARRLVRRQLAARLAPLIGCAPGERPLEAAALSVQLLNAGAQGGYARDVAAQVSNTHEAAVSHLPHFFVTSNHVQLLLAAAR
jgi:hypothetical protein